MAGVKGAPHDPSFHIGACVSGVAYPRHFARVGRIVTSSRASEPGGRFAPLDVALFVRNPPYPLRFISSLFFI